MKSIPNFTRVDGNKANSTFFQGIIATDTNALYKAFGFPQVYLEGKTKFEWILKFFDGTIATIYDYKDDVAWHVGGFDENALKLVKEVLEETK